MTLTDVHEQENREHVYDLADVGEVTGRLLRRAGLLVCVANNALRFCPPSSGLRSIAAGTRWGLSILKAPSHKTERHGDEALSCYILVTKKCGVPCRPFRFVGLCALYFFRADARSAEQSWRIVLFFLWAAEGPLLLSLFDLLCSFTPCTRSLTPIQPQTVLPISNVVN